MLAAEWTCGSVEGGPGPPVTDWAHAPPLLGRA